MAIISVKQGKAVKTFKPRNYVDFWSDHINHKEESALGGTMLKAIKLKSYQNAIANFVKILTNKDIPVVYKGADSYTNGERVVLAGDLNDRKFDVSAGLALHEASHIKHTNWETLKRLNEIIDTSDMYNTKQLLNWIEDRRIDNLVFKSSPGYKGYYHSMYDHYFRSKEVTMMLQSTDYRELTYSNYMAHLVNMMNPAFDSNALPGLRAIVALIDVNNIDRLKDTDDALDLAIKVNELIKIQLEKAKQQEQQNQEQQNQEQQGGAEGEEQEEQEGEEQEGEEQEGEEQEGQKSSKLSLRDKAKVDKKMDEITNLINNNVEKKQLKNTQARMVGEVTISGVEIASTVGGKFDCMVYRLDHKTRLVEDFVKAKDAFENLNHSEDYQTRTAIRTAYYQASRVLPPSYQYNTGNKRKDVIENWIKPGVQLGAILGRKLLVRKESRSLETNRLRSGKIDTKRIAHAGYGIESIFNQITIESKKDAIIHLTLDASRSMAGSKWNNSIKLAASLVKAVSMVEGVELQISTRDSGNFGSSHLPVLTVLYDSKINTPQYGYKVLSVTNAFSLTPEGICLEALMDKKIIKPSTQATESYMINVCDGDPFFEGNGNKCRYYNTEEAVNHTRKQVRKMNNELGIKHAGFFMGDPDSRPYRAFQQMYGAKQTMVMQDANNAMHIAQHINKQLMA